MKLLKYINTSQVVKLTGRSYDEIISLVKSGELPSHRNRRGHFRLNVDAVEEYFDIQINKPNEEEEKIDVLPASGTRLIVDNFYPEVIKRICEARLSIKIMTGDFKHLNLRPTDSQVENAEENMPFIKYLLKKSLEGVNVQIICAFPSIKFKEELDECFNMDTRNFSTYFCIRNHAKLAIVDGKWAYLGSANFTKAGLGQPIFSKGNFEAGIITDDPEMVSSLDDWFSKIRKGEYCESCHRKENCVEY